jgi:2-polyprenyl-3-methyl-5-hydroxy-6-metoxy-1,4-benzoquinol methylase
MKQIEQCPICNNTEQEVFLSVKDHMITQEQFSIVRCKGCGFHFTNPIPDPNKIGDYYKSEEYVSHSSSKKGIINFLYGVVRKRTLNQKVVWLNQSANGKTLLDVGCGTGHFLRTAKAHGYGVTGIDPDEDARRFAKEENGIEPLPQQELYGLPENSFDAITMWHVLEHVYELNADLAKMATLLKPDGVFMIAVPNMASYDAQHYQKYWAAYDVPRHLYHFQQEDMVSLMDNHGFDLKKVLPMKYDAYYVSMLSEKYKKGSLLKALITGWKSNRKAKDYGFSSQVYVFQRKSA